MSFILMYDTWGSFTLLCEKYLIICNLLKTSQIGSGLKELMANRKDPGHVISVILLAGIVFN